MRSVVSHFRCHYAHVYSELECLYRLRSYLRVNWIYFKLLALDWNICNHINLHKWSVLMIDTLSNNWLQRIIIISYSKTYHCGSVGWGTAEYRGSSNTEALVNADYRFIAIASKSTRAGSGSTWYGPIYGSCRTKLYLY